MKVVYSQSALRDIDEILTYIRDRSPEGARRVEERLRRVLERISEQPESAELMAGAPGARCVPLVRYPYVVCYEVIGGSVTVLRIMHGRRETPWSGPTE
jgi:toxin ParE1/3/4